MSDSCNRCGASNQTIVLSSWRKLEKNFSRAPAALGENPSNINLSVGNPDKAMAIVTALGPGITETEIPAAIASRINLKPGSLTVGIPASETTNTSAPDFKMFSNS
ncbi:unannotated protein [freshwater metagenome]|uniref:Unannotated protein n=1 Tax=freshwater metagenome TaxID=449393 RepID=A0A6J6M6A0_9ZZZZ